MKQHGTTRNESITGTIPGKRRRGRHGMQYVDNVNGPEGASSATYDQLKTDQDGRMICLLQ